MTIQSDSTVREPIRLAVLLLAAGQGSRLGSVPKALLKKDGQTLLERSILAIAPFDPVEFVMVTGFHAQSIEPYVDQLIPLLVCPITIVRNPAPEMGQASSIRLGLESLKSDFDALLVCLSDQPEITQQEIKQLLESFSTKAAVEEIILPMVNGQRGNPVLFSRKVIKEILLTPDLVCRPYMDAHPEKVRLMQTTNQAFVLDVDTLKDIQTLQLSRD